MSQKRANVTRRRKGKDRNDTSNFELPDNSAGRLFTSFWGIISPNGFSSQTLGAGAMRAAKRRYAESFNRDHGRPTHRAALDIDAAIESINA